MRSETEPSLSNTHTLAKVFVKKSIYVHVTVTLQNSLSCIFSIGEVGFWWVLNLKPFLFSFFFLLSFFFFFYINTFIPSFSQFLVVSLSREVHCVASVKVKVLRRCADGGCGGGWFGCQYVEDMSVLFFSVTYGLNNP